MTDTSLDVTNTQRGMSDEALATSPDAETGDNVGGQGQALPGPALPFEPGEHPTARATGTLAAGTAGPSMPLSYRTGFFLASMVGGLSSVCIKQLLLPIQVSHIAPATTTTTFALVASLGACAGLIAAPLSGALSDRTTLRWGRRRPWIIVGITLAVIGLLIMAQAKTLLPLVVGEMLAQVGVDSILATMTALIPDQFPEGARTGPSVLNGMAPIVGGVLGLVLVTTLTNPSLVWQGYLLLAAVSVGLVGLFLFMLRERPIRQDEVAAFRWRLFLSGFVRPLASRDFTCVLLSRTLIFLSFTILGTYTFFYLSQVLRMAPGAAASGVTTFQLISTGMLIVGALGTGFLAERVQRFKPFLIGGALLMAAGLAIIALFPLWVAMVLAAMLFGSGFGACAGLDIAVAVQVLPQATERGKDLGILRTAIFLPLIVSPLLGAVILNAVHSFAMLFLVAAFSSVLAAFIILPAKAVQ